MTRSAFVAWLAALLVVVVAPGIVSADDPADWTPVPLRIRNLTFPTLLVMGFKPAPAASLPKGSWAYEVDLSVSNNFQMSDGVETLLAQRSGPPRPLDASDVAMIRDERHADEFLVDAEIGLVEIGLHYGLTDNLSASLQLSHLSYGGGLLDSVIWDFHDAINIDQAGRQYVARDRFQVIFIGDDGDEVLLDRPTTGGLTDPVLGLTWTSPSPAGGWRWGVQAGVKIPLADPDLWLSSGSIDAGIQFTAERQGSRNACVLNLSLVVPGRFDTAGGFDPPHLPALDVAWIHRMGRRTTAIVQILFSENIFREVTDSDLAEAEFQLSTGLTWAVAGGRLGLAVTENLFNYDNTPDFGVHLSFGRIVAGRSR